MGITKIISRLMTQRVPPERWEGWLGEQGLSEEQRAAVMHVLAHADPSDFADATETGLAAATATADTAACLRPAPVSAGGGEPRLGHEGQRFGDYRLLRHIASGVFGEVWAAHFHTFVETKSGAPQPETIPTCLKFLFPDRADLEDVLSEARAMASIRHDNVVAVYEADYNEETGVPYIAMELVGQDVDGEFHCARSLTAEIAREGAACLSPTEMAQMMIGISNGVHAAHLRRNVHRDLKPDNVLVEPLSRRPKVTDFGLVASASPGAAAAAEGGSSQHATYSSRGIGTPAYMSPEQAREAVRRVLCSLDEQASKDRNNDSNDIKNNEHSDGRLGSMADAIRRELAAVAPPPGMLHEPEPVSQLWDVYSLGAILSFMFTRSAPYRPEPGCPTGMETISILRQVARGDRPPPAPPHVPPTLAKIRDMAMASDPARRYQSALELAADLRRFLEHRPTEADPPTRLQSFALSWRRHSTVATLLTCFALVAAAGAVGYVWSIKNEQRKTAHRFNEIRALSTRILDICDDSLERGLGTSQTAAALLVESRRYLESLSRVAGDDRALLQEVFDAYISVGDIQGNPNYTNIGRPDLAKETYTEAMKLADRINGRDGVDGPHIVVHARLGNVAMEREVAANHYRAALDIARKLHQRSSGEAKAVEYLANCLNIYGLLRMSPSEDTDPHPEDLRAAETMFQEAQALRESLCARDPKNKQFKRDLAICFDNLGELRLLRQNRSAEARDLFSQSLRLRKEIANADPTPTAAREMTVSLEWLGQSHEVMRNYAEALKFYHECEQERGGLASRDPNNAQAQRDLSVAQARVAGILRRLQRYAEAVEWFTRSADVRQRLAQATPNNMIAKLEWCEINYSFAVGVLRDPAFEAEALRRTDLFLTLAGELLAASAPVRRDLFHWSSQLGEYCDSAASQRQAGQASWLAAAERCYTLALKAAGDNGSSTDPAVARVRARLDNCRSRAAVSSTSRSPPSAQPR